MNGLILLSSDTDHMVFLVKVADVLLLLCFALIHKFSLFSFCLSVQWAVILLILCVSGYYPNFLNVLNVFRDKTGGTRNVAWVVDLMCV